MKGKFNKYFVLIWLVVVAIYNAFLFLLVNQFSREYFSHATFWVIYGCMMLAFVLWLVMGIIDKQTKFGGLSPVVTFIYPYVALIFIMTSIMFIFTTKIIIVAIILPMILITGLLAILTVFASMNKQQIEDNPQRIQELFNVESLEDYFKELAGSNPIFKNELMDLVNECEGLLSVQQNNEIENIEKRLFEYAAFIKRNAERNEELNIHNNINRFKSLLREREALIAKLG